MGTFTMVAENTQSTVVTEFIKKEGNGTAYQTEAELESAFINKLKNLKYEYLPIKTEHELIENLRLQLEKLNKYKFSNNEWKRFFEQNIANKSASIEEKTFTIQEDYIKLLETDSGDKKNIYLIDKKNIHNNSLQVINQYEAEEGIRKNRYDVTILVNGIPLVHIELKRRGVDLKEAFNQINRYNRESFWSGSGLFEYIQIFVISNGTFTKYYSNTTRKTHINENSGNIKKVGKRTSNSYEFTSWWADANNKPITDLMDFAETFFTKNTLLNLITKYCVYTTEKLLLVMRPYQIVAAERIINKIKLSYQYKNYGSVNSGGYIWHTTGSGKTLTSFKTAQLATEIPFIDKVLFVVDRKDLDYQTIKEYDKFKEGAANSNKNTAILKQQLEDNNSRIIVTTIQKLSIFISKNQNHAVYKKHVVIIFDECHRSQFGEMHTAIVKSFKNYYIFGFTGTPIFAINSSNSFKPTLRTTEQIFGEKLHTYTILDAISDKNVLPFKVDYLSTVKEKDGYEIKEKKVAGINEEFALQSKQRIGEIVKYIIEHFDQKTKRNEFYQIKDKRISGFNSILCVSSIEAAKKYYATFKEQLEKLEKNKRLKVAIIYSYSPNEEEAQETGEINDETDNNTDNLDKDSREFLEAAIKDYNQMFKTNFDTSADKFQNYYKDVSKKVKDRELDLLIVVNMFLTGFDAPTLNTLWVDKDLRLHGLLQAFSRTNRILNSVKTFGNIVCFRDLEEKTNESIALFGDKNAQGIVLLKDYEFYYKGGNNNNTFEPGYVMLVNELKTKFPLGTPINSESEQKEFIKLFGLILRLRNILTTFDRFKEEDILEERELQDYQSVYINLYNEYRGKANTEKEIINEDVVFEIELIKQIEINVDYIIQLVKEYHKSNMQDKEILAKLNRGIDSSIELRSKKVLIEEFINRLTPKLDVETYWGEFVKEKQKEELDKIIEEEKLKKELTYRFIENCFRNGYVQSTGTAIAEIMPPMSRFTPGGERTKKKENILEKLQNYFNIFKDLVTIKD